MHLANVTLCHVL